MVLLAPFALGTGLPVMLFGTLLSLGVAGAIRWINTIARMEQYVKMAIGILFISVRSFFMGLSLKFY